MKATVYAVNYAAQVIPIYSHRVKPEAFHFGWMQLIRMILLAGSTIIMGRLLKSFLDLRTLIVKEDLLHFDDYTLVLLSHSHIGSFSFLKWVVINRNDYENNLEMVLEHEMVHVRQRHSFDVLFVEALKILCWFNPVLWFYKQSLQEVHEFLADREAHQRERYTSFLVSYALNTPVKSLTNHFFNSSLIKSRITMIYKNRTSRWLLGKYLFVIPIVGAIILLTAARERIDIPAQAGSENQISTVISSIENILPQAESTDETVKAMEENIVVKGTVSDENGVAIPNAMIIISNATRGTSTDKDGKFEISAPDQATLVVSHVSYKAYEFIVDKSKSAYKIVLRKNQNMLSGVVVVGYSNSQKPVDQLDSSTMDKFKVVEQQPEFPGGIGEMWKFLGRNTLYPSEALRAGIHGKVLVSFIINESGSIRNPHITQGLGSGIDEEAIRAVLSMPKWKPAIQNGQPVSVEYTLPIEFKLETPKSAEPKEKFQGALPLPKMPLFESLSTNETEFKARQSNALVIVDGGLRAKRGGAGFDDIEPEQIESITILKGQQALTSYGNQGKYGVILITTKKGAPVMANNRYNNYVARPAIKTNKMVFKHKK